MKSLRTTTTLKVLQTWLPLLTLLISAMWGLYTYIDAQTDLQKQREIQADRDVRVRIVEVAKPFFDRQFAVFIELAQICGKVSTTLPRDDLFKAGDRLRELKNGEVAVLASIEVQGPLNNLLIAIHGSLNNEADSEKRVSEAAERLIAGIKKQLGAQYKGMSGSKEDF